MYVMLPSAHAGHASGPVQCWPALTDWIMHMPAIHLHQMLALQYFHPSQLRNLRDLIITVLQGSIDLYARMLDRAHALLREGCSVPPVTGSSASLRTRGSADRMQLARIEDTSILSRLDARIKSVNQARHLARICGLRSVMQVLVKLVCSLHITRRHILTRQDSVPSPVRMRPAYQCT